jgi:site-specific recombinase XerD/Zn-dependent peptidase ImmA (M78 family)
MQNALSDFVLFCRIERRLAEPTCKAYERDTRACLTFLEDQGVTALAEVRTPDLRRFLAKEATHRPAPSSQSRTVAALRCFFRFCVESEYLERDPAHVLRTPKKREALPDILDRGELSRLLDAPGKEGVWKRLHVGKVQRDRLLLALFAYGGLRRSELLGLDCDDVDLDRRLLRVRNAKGGRQRVVPIHPGLVALFIAYAAVRPETSEQALFLGVHGARLSGMLLALTFRRYATVAGVNKRKRITPHTLRHVFATELLGAGANLRQIQELLGHKHLDSTQRYTRVNAHQLGWSQTELSTRTGIAQGSISKYEKGLQQPSASQVGGLSDALGFSTDFFADGEARPAAVMYRSRSLRSARLEGHVRARLNLARLVTQRLVADVEVDTVARFPDPDMAFESPEAADYLRSAWWIEPGPIEGISDYIEAAGGVVVRADLGTDQAMAAYMHPLSDPVRWFFVNTRVSAGDRLRFSLAHELGHAVLHEGGLAPDTREAENESNLFAGALLLPARDLRAELPRGRLRIEHLMELKRRWGASLQTIAIRVQQIGVISRSELSRLFREISARGYRNDEPVKIPTEQPSLISSALKIHREQHGYSDRELADLARVEPNMLAQLFPEHFRPTGAPHLRVVSIRE